MEATDVWVVPQRSGTGPNANRTGWGPGSDPDIYGWTGAINTIHFLQTTIREFTPSNNQLLGQYFGGKGWPFYNIPNPTNDPDAPIKIPSGANIFAQSPLKAVPSSYGNGEWQNDKYMLSSGGAAPISATIGWAGGTPDQPGSTTLHLNLAEPHKIAFIAKGYLVVGRPPCAAPTPTPPTPCVRLPDPIQDGTTGTSNTANGVNALLRNVTGGFNTAIGFSALEDNNASVNTALGVNALQHNTTGTDNIALGVNAGLFLTTGSDNIDIANAGVAGESSTIRIGNSNIAGQNRAFIVGIRGVTTGNADAVPVLIDSAGQLGTVGSSRRFKKEIKPMEQASEAILSLKPVTFHYKSDKTGTPQFGLIAEEVAGVSPDLVVRDKNGEIYTVRYDAVNAMLLNEFLKEHKAFLEEQRRVQKQEATISQLKSTVAEQNATIAQQQKGMEAVTARLNEQAVQIQNVSAQLEASKPAPQVVNNP
jgi:uncharacterized coiled-coil protein SlyX